ncbi:unnamed protein product [Fusarium graminearum]|uniref:Uncharacterized protein n=1 Tax=Gibberella zeae TaxID=5518 RepID=A0A4E9EBX8_GIBZA|nr:unnamed protein product [Fusarium graminearum]CAF3545518.1 unnamed protein product [Fusarium graminearum]CAG2007638.1 unnamed protein product [Fusarium graminearum]
MKRNRSRKRNSPGKARTSDPRQVSLDQWLEDNADSQGANSGIVFRQVLRIWKDVNASGKPRRTNSGPGI